VDVGLGVNADVVAVLVGVAVAGGGVAVEVAVGVALGGRPAVMATESNVTVLAAVLS
jgi:hypothetical protein